MTLTDQVFYSDGHVWAQTPSGSLVIGANTVTLSPVPSGVNGTDANHFVHITDASGPVSHTVTGATNAAPIVLTLDAVSGLSVGNFVNVSGITGNTAANGPFTISAIVGSTVTLANSSGNAAYVSGGTLTMGPESVLITGGTAVANTSSGTLTFTCRNPHASGCTLQTATAGIAEAVQSASTAGKTSVFVPGGTHTINATTTVPAGFSISGAGRASVLTLVPGQATVSMLKMSGSSSTSTTTATTLTVAARASTVTDTINFASTTGFAVNTMVYLVSGAEGTYGNNWAQMNVITAIASPAVTFRNGIVVPLVAVNAGHAITKVLPVIEASVSNLTLDGMSLGADRAANLLIGVEADWTSNCLISGIVGRNWTAVGAIYASGGYNLRVDGVDCFNCGSSGSYGVGFYGQTNLTATNINSSASSGFGIGFANCTLITAANLISEYSLVRNLKLNGCAYGNFSNITVNASRNANGLGISQGTYNVNFRNVIANDNKGSEGIWFSSQDNQYNLIDGLTAFGNATYDAIIYVNDTHNVIRDYKVGIPIAVGNATNEIVPAFTGTQQTAVAVATGANNNLAIAGSSWIQLAGAVGAYSVTGFAAGYNGQMLHVVANTSAVSLTFAHNSASSSAGNKIIIPAGGDLVLGVGYHTATFRYGDFAGAGNFWILMSSQ